MTRIIPDWVRKGTPAHKKAIGLKHGFRSGLEEKLSDHIKLHGHTVRFELVKLKYTIPSKEHSYTPDFELDNGIIIEGKGIFDSSDRAKHLLIKQQYPELDIRFVFSRSKAPIGPGAKSTMAEWCLKYGFKYADKLIPPEWFKERGPAIHPHEVIKRGPYAAALSKERK
jgi:hypothetical protein